MQPTLQSIVTELERLNPQAQIQLPATPTGVRRQILQLALQQQQLATVQNQVFVLFGVGSNPSTQRTYLILTRVIDDMTRDIQSLRLLAEESFTDPEGAAACLQIMQKTTPDFTTRLRRSQALLMKQVVSH